MPRYQYMVQITERPIPEGIQTAFHYFFDEKAAQRFASKHRLACSRLHKFDHGATFLKPIAFPIFRFRGQFYEMRMEFPYEETQRDVVDSFLKGEFACDCSRQHILSFSPEFAGKDFPCGKSIKLESLRVRFENDPTDYVLHG